jgi:GDP-mannose 6-dehydrogenase
LRAALSSRFFVLSHPAEALMADTVVICAGTPAENNEFNLSGVRSALLECRAPKGSGLRRHYILRSTLTPGTIQREILPLLQAGEKFDFSYYPEFLREKFLREDSLHPPLLAAAHSSPSAQKRFAQFFPGNFHELSDFSSVEALKIACNAFHALKVVFANEMAELCEKTGASAEEMMRVFCADQKLNLSHLYLKPGQAFGGPCLDKDLRALEGALDQHEIRGELLRSIRKSNGAHQASQTNKISPTAARDDLFELQIESAEKECSLPVG